MSISFSTYVLNLASVYNQLETGVEVAVGAVLTSGLWVASTLLSNCFHTLENPVTFPGVFSGFQLRPQTKRCLPCSGGLA